MSSSGITAFVGDSLTEGGRWQEWFPEEDVRNYGVGGDTTDDLLGRLSEIVAAAPATIVLLIGTNDLAWRRSAEHIVRNIETVLVNLRRDLPESQILVQSVIARGAEFADQIRDINRHIWQFAHTVRAQYLDLWPTLALTDGNLDPDYTEDGLHLNEAGYQAWLSELRPALETVRGLPPTSRAIILPRAGHSGPKSGF